MEPILPHTIMEFLLQKIPAGTLVISEVFKKEIKDPQISYMNIWMA